MEDEKNLQSVSGEDSPAVDTTEDYLAAIKELKQNSVSRSEYDAIRSENKKLLETIINGQTVVSTVEEPKVDVNELKEKLYANPSDSVTNLEYVTNTLKLREEIMKKGGEDPFEAGNATAHDLQAKVNGEKVAMVLQECVDNANGDSQVFNMELKRHIK